MIQTNTWGMMRQYLESKEACTPRQVPEAVFKEVAAEVSKFDRLLKANLMTEWCGTKIKGWYLGVTFLRKGSPTTFTTYFVWAASDYLGENQHGN